MTALRQTAAVLAAILLGALGAPEPAAAQSLAAHPSDAQFRDMALAPGGAVAYFAAYDRGEVWEIDVDTGERLRSAAVGRGPSQLAVSADGAWLAAVNSLEGSVSLVALESFAAAAPIPTGEGACAVTAMPGGGFAVANAFADTVSLVDPRQPDKVFEFSIAASVPNAVAASDAHLAVASRAASSILFYPPGAREPSATAVLGAPVAAMAALSGDRFAAALPSEIVVVSGAGAIIARAPIAASDIAVYDGRIHALADGAVLVLASDLSQAAPAMAVGEPGAALAAAHGAVVVSAPKSRRWYGHAGAAPAAAVASSPIPSTAPAPMAEPVAEPAPEPEPALVAEPTPPPVTDAVEEEEAAPAVEPEAPAPAPAMEPAAVEPSPEPAPAPAEEPIEEPAPAFEPAAESAPEEKAASVSAAPSSAPPARDAAAVRPPTSGVRQTPLRLDQPRAPRANRRPAESPLPDDTQPTLFDGLAGMRPFGSSEGGFVLPDLTDDEANLSADVTEQSPDGTVLAQGNVRFVIDETQFTMDNLNYNRDTGELHGSGNVVITQAQSQLTADDIYFVANPPAAEGESAVPAGAAPVEGAETSEASGAIGLVQMQNVHLVEPQREFTAAYLEYNFGTESGLAREAQGQIGVFYFGAAQIVLSGETAVDATDVWITTCDCDHDYYKLRFSRATLSENEVFVGKTAQLELFSQATPLFWPRWRFNGPGAGPAQFTFDFDSGTAADIGYFVNVGQSFAVSPYLDLGFRLFPTQKQGVGFGFEGQYDFRDNPASPLFRSKGSFRTMYTTEKDGHIEWYHRQDIAEDTVLTAQWEQWFTEDFVKDFYYEEYRNRTEPRTFVNVTHTKPRYIATGTLRKTTNDDVAETERLPEATFHLLERPLIGDLYVTYDGVAGYNEREPSSDSAGRVSNVGRLTYDIDLGTSLSLTPYLEVDATWYADTWDREGGSDGRFSPEFGVTAQTRLQRTYPGAFGFSAFKHIFIPSITYSYRPEPSITFEETPRFDALDNIFGRSRIETKLSNVLYGRDAETEEVWQVARVTLYQGNDFWNESRKAEDYEIEIDIRPRPEWGVLMVGERHRSVGDFDLDDPFPVQRAFLELYENIFDKPYDPEASFRYNSRFGDYSRVLSYVYYDDPDARWNGRLGFNYTETQARVFNREILYGLGYELNEKWSVAFEHRYDLERDELARQSYEIHRVFNCLEAGLEFRERNSGWDVRLAFSLSAFPGTGIRF